MEQAEEKAQVQSEEHAGFEATQIVEKSEERLGIIINGFAFKVEIDHDIKTAQIRHEGATETYFDFWAGAEGIDGITINSRIKKYEALVQLLKYLKNYLSKEN